MRFIVLFTLLIMTGSFTQPALAQARDEWKPVEPAHLALAALKVEKDAGAEALLWEMRVEKEVERALVSHYLRIKVFNERGRESQSTVEIPYFKGVKIRDVAGRTIKADGQTVELKRPGRKRDRPGQAARLQLSRAHPRLRAAHWQAADSGAGVFQVWSSRGLHCQHAQALG
jgi:hypothetical protein